MTVDQYIAIANGVFDLSLAEAQKALNSGQYLEELNILNLHFQVYEWLGLRWGGFEGCLRYKSGGGHQFTEDEAKYWADQFPSVNVLLLHAGPKGMLDDPSDDVNVGSEAVRSYVLQKNPKYVFCGHQYSNEDLEVNGTKLFRTYGARLIEIPV
jgi:Icc-related predicted phosphoesterase